MEGTDKVSYQVTISSHIQLGVSSRAIPGISLRCLHTRSTIWTQVSLGYVSLEQSEHYLWWESTCCTKVSLASAVREGGLRDSTPMKTRQGVLTATVQHCLSLWFCWRRGVDVGHSSFVGVSTETPSRRVSKEGPVWSMRGMVALVWRRKYPAIGTVQCSVVTIRKRGRDVDYVNRRFKARCLCS